MKALFELAQGVLFFAALALGAYKLLGVIIEGLIT